MTLKEISRYYELNQKLIRNNEALIALRTAAENTTANLDGMPHSIRGADQVALYGGMIAELEMEIEETHKELHEARKEAEAFISTLDSAYDRMIFTLRFIGCKSWREVADGLGYQGSLNSLRMICYRQLEPVSRQF